MGRRNQPRYQWSSPQQWLKATVKDTDCDRLTDLLNHLADSSTGTSIQTVFDKYMIEDGYYDPLCEDCGSRCTGGESEYDKNGGVCDACVETCSECGSAVPNDQARKYKGKEILCVACEGIEQAKEGVEVGLREWLDN